MQAWNTPVLFIEKFVWNDMNKQILVGLTVDAMISNLSHKSFNFEDQIKKEALFFVNNPSINLILQKKKKKKKSIY